MTKENSKILITKVKLNNDDTAHIEFKKSDNLGAGSTSWDGEEKVTEDFKKTFQDSVNSFCEIIPALREDKSKITMNAITFNYGNGEKIEKVSYTVKYTPQSSVLTNIPINNIPIYKESFTEKTFSVSGKDEKLLYSILDCAQGYLNGDTRTKQIKLEVV